MLVQWLFALLIAGAFNKDLVEDLDDQLTECTNILNHAERDSEDDGDESLDTCMAVVQAANDFYNDIEGIIDVGSEDPIILNVGGTRFSTTLATLRSVNGTFFEKMFRNESMATSSADGSYFIDRNPKAFEYILDFLRTGDMLLESADCNLLSQLLEDVEFFELTEELKDYLKFSCMFSIDLSFSEVTWLNNLVPSQMKLGGLLMDTFKDDDTAADFYERTNTHSNTVTIVETSLGVIFGGFTTLQLGQSPTADPDAFVFRLRPSPEKFPVIDSSRAITRSTAYGPYFGSVTFRISSNCRDNSDSYVTKDNYYGVDSLLPFNGYRKFRVKNYVVVKVQQVYIKRSDSHKSN